MLVSCFALVFAFNVSDANAADTVLLHGMGSDGNGSQDAQLKYWGGTKDRKCTKRRWGRCKRYETRYNIASWAPGSKHIPFTETRNRGWDNRGLQNFYVNNANGHGKVIAHSMANTILAGACYQQGKCVRWNNTSGPLLGSYGGTVAKAVCQGGAGGIDGIAAGAFKPLAKAVGLCNAAAASLDQRRAEFGSAAYKNVLKRQINKSFCGHVTYAFRVRGENKGTSRSLKATGLLLFGANNSDGAVEYSSCSYAGNVTRARCDHMMGAGGQGPNDRTNSGNGQSCYNRLSSWAR